MKSVLGSRQWAVLQGDCRELLRAMPAESVHICVTSPPYWGLRDYGLPPPLAAKLYLRAALMIGTVECVDAMAHFNALADSVAKL